MSDSARSDQLNRLIDAARYRKDGRTNFFNDYKVGSILGQGSFGTVYLTVDKETRVPCATKIINRQAIKENDKGEKLTTLLKNELHVMQYLQKVTLSDEEDGAHRNLTKVIGIYKDAFQYYFVMELVTGGTLLDFFNEYREMSVENCENLTKKIVG